MKFQPLSIAKHNDTLAGKHPGPPKGAEEETSSQMMKTVPSAQSSMIQRSSPEEEDVARNPSPSTRRAEG